MEQCPFGTRVEYAEFVATKRVAWVMRGLRVLMGRWHVYDVDPEDYADMAQGVYELILRDARMPEDMEAMRAWLDRSIKRAARQWLDARDRNGKPADPNDMDWDGYEHPAVVRRRRALLGELNPDTEPIAPYRGY